jgi:hypothetical protein
MLEAIACQELAGAALTIAAASKALSIDANQKTPAVGHV